MAKGEGAMQDVIDELYQTHKAQLVRFARGLTRSRDAEDLVHDTFERAMAHIVQLSAMPEAKQRAWLYTVTRNLWRDRQRRQQVESRWLESEKHYVRCSSGMMTQMADITIRLEWRDLLGRLPANLRDIVIQRYWQGLNSREMAHRLKLPEATIRARLRAAIRVLRTADHQVDLAGLVHRPTDPEQQLKEVKRKCPK